eukprot:m.433356 g.433356  ORF g.433356 m.433356 type:complete len:302 (-) comp21417_c0_seq20:631-1536(-)
MSDAPTNDTSREANEAKKTAIDSTQSRNISQFNFQGAAPSAASKSDSGSVVTAPVLFNFGGAADGSWSIPNVEIGLGGGIAGAKDTPIVSSSSKDTTNTIIAGQDEDIAVDIKPIIKLPEVEVPTGEEAEDVIFTARAKMFVWGEGNAGWQWKERGVGPLKLLKHKDTGYTRLLMRRDQTLKMCANHLLTKTMRLESSLGERAWVYSCLADYSDAPEVKRITVAVRFKTRELAEEFAQKFNLARDANNALHETGVSPTADHVSTKTDDEEAAATCSEEAVQAVAKQVKDLTMTTEDVPKTD